MFGAAINIVQRKHENIENILPNIFSQAQNKNLLYVFTLIKTYDPECFSCVTVLGVEEKILNLK